MGGPQLGNSVSGDPREHGPRVELSFSGSRTNEAETKASSGYVGGNIWEKGRTAVLMSVLEPAGVTWFLRSLWSGGS